MTRIVETRFDDRKAVATARCPYGIEIWIKTARTKTVFSRQK